MVEEVLVGICNARYLNLKKNYPLFFNGLHSACACSPNAYQQLWPSKFNKQQSATFNSLKFDKFIVSIFQQSWNFKVHPIDVFSNLCFLINSSLPYCQQSLIFKIHRFDIFFSASISVALYLSKVNNIRHFKKLFLVPCSQLMTVKKSTKKIQNCLIPRKITICFKILRS